MTWRQSQRSSQQNGCTASLGPAALRATPYVKVKWDGNDGGGTEGALERMAPGGEREEGQQAPHYMQRVAVPTRPYTLGWRLERRPTPS